jgi:glycosyltransferase involved in cell wall biosynthesis
MNRSAHPFGERRRRVTRSESAPFDVTRACRLPDTFEQELSRLFTGSLTHVTTSVLVSTFNDAPFIEDCIESLLVQSILPDEIIVYDLGSDDDTLTRLRRYGSRISLLELPNQARSRTNDATLLAAAYARSRGQMIFLLNGHDRFKRNKIESYVSVFTANPDAALVQAPMDKIDEHGRVVGHNVEPRKHVVEHLKETERRQDVDFYYPKSALAFSRHCLGSLLPLDEADALPLSPETRLSVVAPYFGRVITLPDRLSEWRRPSNACTSSPRRPRRFHVQQTLARAKVYNAFCRRHGLSPISPWQNTRFYLQLLRYSLPDLAYRLFYHKIHRSPDRSAASRTP